MTRVLIVYFSSMGHTEAIARSVMRGIKQVDGVEVDVIRVQEIDGDEAWARLDSADALVFGSPTYMGTVAADFKKFMDQSGSRWYERAWMDKLAAGFTVGGGLSGDKQGTLQSLHTFASQHGMIWISMGVGVREPDLDRLSSSVGLMSQAANAPADQTPPPEDHATAEAFGARIAHLTHRWVRGEAVSQ
jgi:NAD(P)H dehydrogenase (quinone)